MNKVYVVEFAFTKGGRRYHTEQIGVGEMKHLEQDGVEAVVAAFEAEKQANRALSQNVFGGYRCEQRVSEYIPHHEIETLMDVLQCEWKLSEDVRIVFSRMREALK